VNQAVKAVAIALRYLTPNGVQAICIPSFTDVVIDNEEKTALKFVIEPR
jgi:stage V sporulation protein S